MDFNDEVIDSNAKNNRFGPFSGLTTNNDHQSIEEVLHYINELIDYGAGINNRFKAFSSLINQS